MNGCPDRDNDGIRDRDDECPDFPGLMKNNGCPDKDGDGIIDKYDRCPDIPGIPEQNGCPDSDGDGLQDQLDKCPYVKGSLRNLGCPDTLVISEIDTVVIVTRKTVYDSLITWNTIDLWVEQVYFEFNTHKLDKNAKMILNKIAKFLVENKGKDIEINGHADERGSDRYNMKLSKKRSESVMGYLIIRGVDKNRLTANGFGESQKVSSSHEENRRVEFKIIE